MARIAVIIVPQADGGRRYIALAEESARVVRRDRAMIDYVATEAIQEDGRWERPFSCLDTLAGRRAIRRLG